MNKTRATFDKNAVMDAVSEAGRKSAIMAGLIVEREMKRLLSVGGRRRDGKKMISEPSTPPDPPHAQTGNLHAAVTSDEDANGHVLVGPTGAAWYGRVHEFGGRHHPKRPFAAPALENVRGKLATCWKGLKLDVTKAGRRAKGAK